MDQYYFLKRIGVNTMADRRRFIGGIATASIATIAGCTGSDIVDLQSDQSGPEAAVEQFTTASLLNGNPSAASEVLHPESPESPINQDDVTSSSEITISDIRQISPRDLVELNAEASGGASEEEIQNRVSALNERVSSLVENAGAEDHAFVIFTVKSDEDQIQFLVSVVQDSGDWLIYQSPSRIASPPDSVGLRQAQAQQETTSEVRDAVQIGRVVGNATDDGKIDSLRISLRPAAGSDPVNIANTTFIIEMENSITEVSGDTSTPGVEYTQVQSLSDGETTLSDGEDLLVAELDLTEAGVNTFEKNQQGKITIEIPDGISSEKEFNTPRRIDGGESYLM
jgi:hypothetical protein